MDGTLLRLGIAPSCSDAADYSGRKFLYSLTVCASMMTNGRLEDIFLVSLALLMTTEYGET